MRLTWRVYLVFLLIILAAPGVSAQNELLVNGGLEEGSNGPYTTRRGGEFPIYLPNSWNVWLASPTGEFSNRSERVSVNPHPGPGPAPKEGSRALNVDCGFVTCTASIYQQVAVQDKSNIQASAWAQVKACDLPPDGTTCGSAVESGAQTRIGIDPNGGTDPNDTDVVWSGWVQPHDNWLQMTVSATTAGTTATLFLYSTQSSASDLNRTYWDQVSLTGGGTGGAAAPAGSTPVPTAPPEVAFVVPQNEREDGSLVHIVAGGDTIDSIAVAYGLTRPDILALNPDITDPRIISIGQEIVIREPLPTEGESFTEEVEATESQPEATGEATSEAVTEAEATPQVVDGGATSDFASSAPPAPVVSVAEGAVLPPSDPSALSASICTLLFNDVNQNRIQEPNETILAGGSINLTQSGSVVQTVDTDGIEPYHCFSNVESGGYVLAASAPDGFGLTSPDQLSINVAPGAAVSVAFGAAEGVQSAAPPPADAGGEITEVSATSSPVSSPLSQLFNMSGLLVFGLAGVVLVAGLGLALFLRRR